jgi:hypothetical protein
MREYYPEFVGVDYDSNEQVYSVSFAPLGRVSLRLGLPICSMMKPASTRLLYY